MRRRKTTPKVQLRKKLSKLILKKTPSKRLSSRRTPMMRRMKERQRLMTLLLSLTRRIQIILSSPFASQLNRKWSPKLVPTRPSIWTSISIANLLAAWLLTSLMRLLRLQRTSVLCALVRREKDRNLARSSASRNPSSIASFLALWLKVVISLTIMVQVVSQSMARNLLTKTSSSNTLHAVCFPWPTLDLVPTVVSSSFASLRLLIWMAVTSYSVKCVIVVLPYCAQLKLSVHNLVPRDNVLRSLIAVSSLNQEMIRKSWSLLRSKTKRS